MKKQRTHQKRRMMPIKIKIQQMKHSWSRFMGKFLEY